MQQTVYKIYEKQGREALLFNLFEKRVKTGSAHLDCGAIFRFIETKCPSQGVF